MKRLLINADDLGINPARSHGIFLAWENGIVRSATVIPNFADSATAARHARERGLNCGLHINLTEWYPLSTQGDVETLLTPNGTFRPREELRRLLDEGEVETEHLEREIRAQLEWFLDHYGQPTHVDSHHHIHIHPAVIPVVMPILDRYGIDRIRIPVETLPPHGWVLTPEELARAQVIVTQAEQAKALYTAHGFRSTDHFRGLALAGRASKKNLRHILSRLPEGTTELMTHPGSPCAAGSEFDIDPQRVTELNMLTDEGVPALLKQYKIEVGSFGDL